MKEHQQSHAGFVIDNHFLTALVAVAVSARTFTCEGITLFISPS